jgi:probable addiction module antidote protein
MPDLSDLKPFDAANYLETPEDIAAFLEAAAEEDDPAFLMRALGIAARSRGMVKLARDSGISREGLYKALGEDGNPTLSTLMAVAKALDLRIAFIPRG